MIINYLLLMHNLKQSFCDNGSSGVIIIQLELYLFSFYFLFE